MLIALSSNGLQRTQRRNPRQRHADAAGVGSTTQRASDRAPLATTHRGGPGVMTKLQNIQKILSRAPYHPHDPDQQDRADEPGNEVADPSP